MRKIFITNFLLAAIFTSCIHENKNFKINHLHFSKFPIEDTITFSNICEYKEGDAGMLFLIDSNIIIFNVNAGTKYLLNNYSIKKKQFSNGYIKVGRGKSEVVGAIGMGVNGNRLWIHDITLKKIITFDKTEALSDCNLTSLNEYPLREDFFKICFKDSATYLGVGNPNSEFRIQEVNLNSGKIIKEYGIFESIPIDIEFKAFKAAHQSYILINPSGDKVVLACRYTDLIEVIDFKTQKSVLIHGPEGFNVDFQPSGEEMFRTAKTRFAFVSGGGTVSNNYIYLCYSGGITLDRNSYYARYIYIYDWYGNPVRKLTLNRRIQGIAISDDKTIYAFDVDSGFLISSNIN